MHKVFKINSISIIFTFMSLLYFMNSAFGWSLPKRLTYHLAATNPRAVIHGGRIEALAWGYPGYDFPFFCSPNGGYSWSNPIEPADTFYDGSQYPDIIRTPNGLVHVVWIAQPYPNAMPQLYHQSSSDGGRNWSDRHQVFRGAELALYYPRLASKVDTLFLVCRNLENIMTFRSFDDGLTWQDSTVVGSSDAMAYPPTILYSQGRLHLIYEIIPPDTLTGFTIYYNSSNDLGLTWTPKIPLSSIEVWPISYDSQFPSAYADSDGHIMATWFDYKYGSMCGTTGDILARVSTDNGDSWLPETRLTHNQSGNASSCLILNNVIYVAWRDSYPFGCDYAKIVLAHSNDWGLNWSQSEIITQNTLEYENDPFLFYSQQGADTLFHCLFTIYDNSFGTDIYYIRDKSFFSDHAPHPPIQPVILDIKASPSVFNSSTLISYENKEGEEGELEIYDILGRKVWSKNIYGKKCKIIWDATDMNGVGLSSGIYMVRAISDVKTAVAKIAYIK